MQQMYVEVHAGLKAAQIYADYSETEVRVCPCLVIFAVQAFCLPVCQQLLWEITLL